MVKVFGRRQAYEKIAALMALGGWRTVAMVLRYAHVNVSLGARRHEIRSGGVNEQKTDFPGFSRIWGGSLRHVPYSLRRSESGASQNRFIFQCVNGAARED
ncbi:MAG: hypothetical protein ABSC25_05370 [Roseiarcus sp.]|jgi:hypothetical protein